MAWAYNTADDTPNNGPTITAVALSMTGLAFVALCLRIYVRTRIAKAVGLGTYSEGVRAIVIAASLARSVEGSGQLETKWGLGLIHLDDMPDENLLNFGKVEKQWEPLVPGHCADAVTFYLTFSSLTIIFDVITLVLPFPVLVKLQMKRRRKMALLCLFALGLFVTIVQIIRIQTIKNLANYLDSAEAIKWSIVETAVGIIIACVPTLAPLVTYFSEKTRSGGSNNTPARPGGEGPYALQSWRAAKNGMRPLASAVDGENGSEKSTENILQGPIASASEASEASDRAGSHERAPSATRKT
ncbi:integral membrane [Trichoderma arundinaceum]|uniref:Integral membrane n=1 Tax=Trichoderma arundinaceum TaxID=490622 RepID=A0A395NQH5_TRIAR|nr:integral membrane [Trichoderma arundinaceum]